MPEEFLNAIKGLDASDWQALKRDVFVHVECLRDKETREIFDRLLEQARAR